MLEAKECQINTTRFRLYVTPAKTGKFVAALAAAKTDEDVANVLESIRIKLAKLKTPPACVIYLQQLLDAPKEKQEAIVVNFELEVGSSDPLDSIRDLLRPGIAETEIDILVKSGIGLAKQAFDRLIQRGKKPVLDADDFRKDLHAFIRRNNLPNLLTSLSDIPSEEHVSQFATTRPTFIRQLELVEASPEDRLRAVSDFLRTSADKAKWAENGFIFSGSLIDWDDNLLRQHGLVRGDIADLHSDKPTAVQGRLIYRKCAQYQAPLEGRAVPGHFIHGSFNDLADRRRLGWHMDHQRLLDGEEK
jgi:hypothetical protein